MSFQDVDRGGFGANSNSRRGGGFAAGAYSGGNGSFADGSSSSTRFTGPGARGGGGASTTTSRTLSPMNGGSSSTENGAAAPRLMNGSISLKDALLQYQQQVAIYEKLSRDVGGLRDTAELRAQLQAQESVVKETGRRLEQQAGAQLRATEGIANKIEKDRVRAEINKMGKDAQRLKARFDNTVRTTAGRTREVDLLGRRQQEELNGRGGGGGVRSHQQLLQQQQVLTEDIDERLLQEREEEIMVINQSVVKVNEIFRDLGELVARQQEDIDTIEQNVQQSHAAAKSGLEQVEKAAKYQPGCSIS